MKSAFLTMPVAIAAALVPGHAGATPLTSDLLTDFNAIVGNFSSTSETEGAVIVGGTLSGSSATFDTRGGHPSGTVSGFGDVNVYGDTSGGPYNVNNLAVKVATAKQTATFSGGSVTYSASLPYSYASISGQLTKLSTTLSTLKTTTGSSLSNSVFTAKPVNGVAVLDLTLSQLQNIGNPSFKLNGAQLFIINVDASSYATVSGQNFNDQGIAANILWNFYNAKSLNFGVEFGGTVLAPGAHVTNSSPIDGTLFAASYTGNGELHVAPLSDASYLNTVQGVPEPSTWMMLIVGFAGAGVMGWRGRGRVAARAA
ncbi:MAG: choice-of-anchor A family protein [Xanthobacteraceae bacterium]|nr:choice-of-anchor A family protein [Xanthobacteraceae bacterium]